MAISNNIRNNLVSRPTANQVITNPLFNGLRVNGNVERIVNQEQSLLSSPSFLNFPFDLPKYYFGIIEMEPGLGGTNPFWGNNLTVKRGYRLPLPSQLSDGYEVQYDHGFNWLGAISSVVGINDRNIGNALSSVLGFSVNNYKQVTLQAPQFRSYSFEWKLSPKNKEESERIKRIEMQIKKGMHPRQSGTVPVIGTPFVFGFPNIFLCFFFPNFEYLYNFKPAVITGIQFDYQGGNHRNIFYKETGAPESIIMRINFLEIDYWLENDFNRGLFGNSDRTKIFEENSNPAPSTPSTPSTPSIPGAGINSTPESQ